MLMLRDVCTELREELVRIQERCLTMSSNLSAFGEFTASFTTTRLSRRLMTLKDWVAAQAKSLYKQYKYRGLVFILLKEDSGGFTLNWARNKRSLLYTFWFEVRGYTVLSVEEMLSRIDDLNDELASGNWTEVVDWLRKYGKSPGLDLDRFSPTTTANTLG